MRGGLALMRWSVDRLDAARGRLFPFVPVGLGAGIGLWFARDGEPGLAAYAALAAACLFCLGLAYLVRARLVRAGQPLLIFLACLCAGPLAGGFRAQTVAAPMLDFRYYGPVMGRILDIDRSQSDAPRLLLDQVVLSDVAADRTPARIRVSLHGDQSWLVPVPGQTIILTAHLAAPEGPVEPGAFDFRRMAFFDRIGAVGYTRSPALLWQPPAAQAQLVGRLRTHLSAAIRAVIPGDSGAFAAGVMTGDRSGLSLDAVQALRDSSLAHLLAISGMNLAFLIGFTFGLLRYGIALVPPLALRVNSKKVAAAVSLGVAAFYLLLSGSNVATERAFIMVSVMLGAVLLDRQALTLRSVALAASVLLLWQPEALLSPGFQMSFAATVALILGFRALSDRWPPGTLPRGVMPVVTVIAASIIGGFATAPYAAAHFNRFTDYGLLANLLTVSVMGLVVMPAGAVAALLAPFGLARPALWVMQQGCDWILYVAHRIAALDGAVTAIPAPPPWGLSCLTLGLVWAVLWPGRARLAGLLPAAVALGVWALAPARPAVLISADGGLVGVMGPQGRALSRDTGGSFAARNWLENDGDLADQATAAARPGFSETPLGQVFALGRQRGIIAAKGAGIAALCARADLVLVRTDPDTYPAGCRIIGPALLRQSGALALSPGASGWIVTATHSQRRPWSPSDALTAPIPPLQ